MKKGIAWLLLAAMLLGLAAGCGNQSPAAQTPREPEEKVMEQVRQGLGDLNARQAQKGNADQQHGDGHRAGADHGQH